jgi:hypothetical protein
VDRSGSACATASISMESPLKTPFSFDASGKGVDSDSAAMKSPTLLSFYMHL